MPLTEIEVDETPHNMDGLLLHGWDGSERVEAFISRRVMESWSIRGALSKTERFASRAIPRTRQAQSCGDCANCRFQVPARNGIQPPASVCGYSAVRHHRKQRGARYERASARTAASLIPSDSTLESSFRSLTLRCR